MIPRRNSVLSDITQQQTNAAVGAVKVSRLPSSASSTPVLSPVVPSTPATDFEVDPITVPEYCEEIIQHLLLRERTSPRDGTYLNGQREVTERMRQILIDWLIDVNLKFKLHPETYFLAVDIIDRFLAKREVTRAQLQLVGITCVLIAAKHEEIWPPEVKDCVYIAANTYSAPEVLAMERDVASCLFFRFTVPTPYPILMRLLDVSESPEFIRHAGLFFLDCSAHDYKLIPCLPSRVACAALLLGRMLVAANSITASNEAGQEDPSVFWDRELEVFSHGVTYSEVEPIARQLLHSATALTAPSSRLQAVRRKYLSQRFGGIAGLAMPTFPSDSGLEAGAPHMQ